MQPGWKPLAWVLLEALSSFLAEHRQGYFAAGAFVGAVVKELLSHVSWTDRYKLPSLSLVKSF